MSQSRQTINSHIETYLDYYCNLSHAPGFAVLLKGQWGSGKTWFINRYKEELKQRNHKCLYVSLYGMTGFSEIEDAFFQQLHPVLSSKGMAITSKILKGFLKGALKIDLNNDSKDDGTINVQVPEINLPDYLRNTDKSILIFDDLERCDIELANILGYINFFVEHQDLKVILIANEDELLKDSSYQVIKEKLIGKTFGISPDFEGALENFITMIDYPIVREFLSDNTELIQDLYKKAMYENLRNLKQIVLDFERIFVVLPEKAKSKLELLQELLNLLMAFSIEIKRGNICPKDISKLQDEYRSSLGKQPAHQPPGSARKNNNEAINSIQSFLSSYPLLNLLDPFPSKLWWQTFFDKGIVDTEELKQSILNSRYFQDENTPDWVRLWHFFDLSDDDFEKLLTKVELDYGNRKFTEIGEIKHIFGLFLKFSHAGTYKRSKEEILKDSKLYVDYLKSNNRLALIASSRTEDSFGKYGLYGSTLAFKGTEFEEFQELSNYIKLMKKIAQEESMPIVGRDLLTTMRNDHWKFYRMICLTESQDGDTAVQKYYEVPILKYIEETAFVNELLSMSFENQRHALAALVERYKYENVNEKLIEELDWLRSVRDLLQIEVEDRKGKNSGSILDLLVKQYLNEAIERIVKKESQTQVS